MPKKNKNINTLKNDITTLKEKKKGIEEELKKLKEQCDKEIKGFNDIREVINNKYAMQSSDTGKGRFVADDKPVRVTYDSGRDVDAFPLVLY